MEDLKETLALTIDPLLMNPSLLAEQASLEEKFLDQLQVLRLREGYGEIYRLYHKWYCLYKHGGEDRG